MDLVTSLIDGDLPLGATRVQADQDRLVVLADDDLDDADLVIVNTAAPADEDQPSGNHRSLPDHACASATHGPF